jgi:hypothetical protein
MPARSIRSDDPEPETKYRRQKPGADFPPMTAEAETSQPARSDSPDLIDGGPDGCGYIPKVGFRQAKTADLRAFGRR